MKFNQIFNKNLILFLFLFVLSFYSVDLWKLFPQEQKSPETKIESPTPAEEGIIDWIKKGGSTMIYLGIIGSLIIGFSMERYFFFKKSEVKTKNYFNHFENLINSDFSIFENFILNDKNLISRVIRNGLLHKNKDIDFIEKQIETHSLIELGKLEKGLNLLSNLGNLAPLIGFFGTVVGMRHSFIQFTIKAAPTAKDLAAGVEEALITTQAGLLIAIPTYLIYNLFLLWIDTITVELERCVNLFLLKIRERKYGHQS